MTMEEEPWDELSGPPPVGRRIVAQDPPSVRSHSAGSAGPPPPAAMFATTRSTSGGGGPPAAAFNSSGAATAVAHLPQRWSQHEADPEAVTAATQQAVYMASTAASRRSGTGSGDSSVASSRRSNTGSAFEDTDMVEMTASNTNNTKFEIGGSDDGSVDSDIGRAYDVDHNHIRQEALRMLEVADADKHYSVHRTITGGFTAQPKALGNQKRTKTALQGLNFVANRNQNNNVGSNKRYEDFATTPQTNRENYEYGDDSVVDVIGLEQRSASAAAAVETSSSSQSSSNWSSRYSIDKTKLAMSGGAMKHKLDRMDREHGRTKTERFSALNMFGGSPKETQSPQVFGSGFSFRQQHVFGKQNVAVPTDNLQSTWNAAAAVAPGSSTGSKTWQEQLVHKRLQQRRWLIAICVGLLCFIVPLVSILGVNKSRNNNSITSNTVPADGFNGSVTFYVTGDAPYNEDEEVKLRHDLAVVSKTTSFAVHLGNIQDAAATLCESSQYSKVAGILEDSSPVPVFVVPGQEDWNQCQDPDEAWDAWYDNFALFDKRWDDIHKDKEVEVYRQKHQLENWAFVQEGVLFMGVNVVNGKVPDEGEFADRNEFNYRWVEGMSLEHEDSIRAIVLFGNAKSGFPQNIGFFAPLEEFWKTYEKPTLYLHASSGAGATKQYQPFADLPHVVAAQIETGVDNPPLRVNVGFGDKPFIMG